jgi:hypothetical protein
MIGCDAGICARIFSADELVTIMSESPFTSAEQLM